MGLAGGRSLVCSCFLGGHIELNILFSQNLPDALQGHLFEMGFGLQRRALFLLPTGKP
jgi:hypothetical protein